MDHTDSRVTTCPAPIPYYQTGQLFSVSYQNNLSAYPNNSFVFVFENPATNTKTMYLESVLGGISHSPQSNPPTLNFYLYKLESFTRTNIFTPQNLNFGSPVTSTVLVTLNPNNIRGVETPIITNHPDGEFALYFNGKVIVPPGHNIGFEIVALQETNFRENASINITWYEV